MKFFVAFLLVLVLVYSKVDAATDADLEHLRDSSVTAYSNLESASPYLQDRGYYQRVSDAVASLSTLNSLATLALPPLSYPVQGEIAYYDGHQSLSDVVSILQTYGPGAPVDVRVYIDAAYRYIIEVQHVLRIIANS